MTTKTNGFVSDFGFKTNGYADLAITKYCVPLRLDEYQFVFDIIVTNNGPDDLDAADNVELFDDLGALAGGGGDALVADGRTGFGPQKDAELALAGTAEVADRRCVKLGG